MKNTPQQPINSGFTASTTAEEVIQGIDLTGKSVIITGGYSGIGLETARILQAGRCYRDHPGAGYKKSQTQYSGDNC